MKIKPNMVLLIVLILAGISACNDAPEPVSAGEERPNILFIMTDDHARRTVSAYKGAINSTPNIDRLSEEGTVFLNSFVANSICNPSRASILTGKHSHKNGVVGNASPWDNNQVLLPRLLKETGYNTALIGKWHMNNPPGDEFNYYNRLTGAGKQGFYYNPEFESGSGIKETVRGHSTDIVTDKALRWLSSNTGGQKDPFLLFVQFKAPHVPRMPEFRFLDRYKNDTLPEPETLFDEYESRAPYAEEANMGMHYRPLPLLDNHDPGNNIYYKRMNRKQLEKWHSFRDPQTREYRRMKENGQLNGKERKRFAYQQFIKDYLRLIDGVDENVGRLLTWLDEHPDIRDNTVVVYTSDQGYFTGEHGWAEKRFMYEEAIRTPLVIRWPDRLKSGTRINAMVQNIDFAPTLLDLADVTIPDEMQGDSFLPIIRGEKPEDWRNSIYYHYYDHGKHNVPRHDGVRTGRYKLIHFYTDDVWEFYDLDKDPNEVNNLYGREQYEEEIQKLKTELDSLRKYYEVPPDHFKPPFVKAGKDQKL